MIKLNLKKHRPIRRKVNEYSEYKEVDWIQFKTDYIL